MGSTVEQIAAAITYADKVFQYLLDMGNGTIIIIDDICKEETKKEFIEAVKLFIDYDYGKQFGFVIDFNSDMTKIQKFQSKEY